MRRPWTGPVGDRVTGASLHPSLVPDGEAARRGLSCSCAQWRTFPLPRRCPRSGSLRLRRSLEGERLGGDERVDAALRTLVVLAAVLTWDWPRFQNPVDPAQTQLTAATVRVPANNRGRPTTQTAKRNEVGNRREGRVAAGVPRRVRMMLKARACSAADCGARQARVRAPE